MEAVSASLKANTCIKVFDISSNQALEADFINGILDAMSVNRSLEYLGLSKLNLTSEMISPFFDIIGRFPFPEDQVENQLAELKKRDAIVEKNKKLKASKKAEEPVPQLDNIEQITRKNEEGEDIQEWVTFKNPQFKHLNLCMNNLDDDMEEILGTVLARSADDFGITISSNKFTEDVIKNLHEKIQNIHKSNIEMQQIEAEAAGESSENIVIDPFIHLRRLAI